MKKILTVLLCVVALVISGCDNRKPAEQLQAERLLTVEGAKINYKEACINGVIYYYLVYQDLTTYSQSLAPAFDKNSKVITCGDAKVEEPN